MAHATYSLPGFDDVLMQQHRAAKTYTAEEQKQLVETALRSPAADISKAAGEIERHSPLFFGLSGLEQSTLFSEAQAISDDIAEYAKRHAIAAARKLLNIQPPMPLFSPAEPAPTLPKKSKPAPLSATEKDLKALRHDLEAAKLDLRDAEYNIAQLVSHWNQSMEGGIDDNWWQRGLELGILDISWDTRRTDGRYSVKVMHWIRHNLRVQHRERMYALKGIAAYSAKLALIESQPT
jgi:hypothetical protein